MESFQLKIPIILQPYVIYLQFGRHNNLFFVNNFQFSIVCEMIIIMQNVRVWRPVLFEVEGMRKITIENSRLICLR